MALHHAVQMRSESHPTATLSSPTDMASNRPSGQRPVMDKLKSMGRAVKGVAVPALEVTGEVADIVPVPGLKIAVSAILTILEGIDVS